MKLSELYAVLEKFAPKELSDEYCLKYDAYDNSGVLIDCNQPIKKVLFSLDFSLKALEMAKNIGANVLVTHHPAIYAKVSHILFDDAQGKKLQYAIENKISVISMHLNFDCAKDGIDEELMRAVGGKKAKIIEPLSKNGCGYGRVYDIPPTTAQTLCEDIKQKLNSTRAWCYHSDKKVARVASFCGAGANETAVMQAVKNKADCLVSADFKHHIIAMAVEYGLSVVQLTHYASENYGFKKIYEKLKAQFGVESEYFTDEELL